MNDADKNAENKTVTKHLYKYAGDAPKPNELKHIETSGSIASVNSYLSSLDGKHLEYWNPRDSTILLDVVNRAIIFRGGRSLAHGITVTGQCELNGIFKELGLYPVDSPKVMPPKDYLEFLRVRKHLFESINDYDSVIGKLRKLNVKISTSQAHERTESNQKKMASVEINHDFEPVPFTLNLKLFKGDSVPEPIKVTLYGDASTSGITLWMECLELPTIIDEKSEERMANQITELSGFGYAIIRT